MGRPAYKRAACLAAGAITLAMIGCTGPAPTSSSTPRSSPTPYVRSDGRHNAENTPPDSGRTTVAYDIDDMLPAGTSGRRGGFCGLPDEWAIERRAKMVGEFVDCLCKVIAPDSWAKAGGKSTIREAGGRLVVTTTVENHRLILDLIGQLREAWGILGISTEIRVLGMSEKADRAWKKALVGHGPKHSLVLDDLQMNAVYKALRGRDDVEMHVLKRQFMNGEALAVGRRSRGGMARLLEVQVTASADRRHINTTVVWSPGCLDKPGPSGAWRRPVPDGASVILPMPSLANISAADRKSLPEITKHPRVYVIIKPLILIPCECEVLAFPGDDQKPAMAKREPVEAEPARGKGSRPCTCGKQCGWSTCMPWVTWE